MKLSVIVAAYNEEKTLLQVLSELSQVRIPDVKLEVIVVDDGSTDKTAHLLKDHPSLYQKLIIRTENGGKGAAVRDGLRIATGDFVTFQDADLEYDPSEFTELLKPILHYHADVVIGSRFLSARMTRVHYFWNLVGNRVLTLFFNLCFNQTFTDIYSCYLIFRRKFVDPERLRSSGFEQHAEILCAAVKQAHVMYDVGLHSYNGRTISEGKKIRAYHALAVFWQILKGRFFASPALLKRLPEPHEHSLREVS